MINCKSAACATIQSEAVLWYRWMKIHRFTTFNNSVSVQNKKAKKVGKAFQPSDVRVRLSWRKSLPAKSTFQKELKALSRDFFQEKKNPKASHFLSRLPENSNTALLDTGKTTNSLVPNNAMENVDKNEMKMCKRDYLELIRHKNRLHKRMWVALKAQKFLLWEKCVEELRSSGFLLDEVSYTLIMHGYLLSNRHDRLMAWDVLKEMKDSNVHPSLLRYNERLLTSYFDFISYGVQPNFINWKKVVRTSWLVAVFFKGRRQRFIFRNAQERIRMGEDVDLFFELENLTCLWKGYDDPLLPKVKEEYLLNSLNLDQLFVNQQSFFGEGMSRVPYWKILDPPVTQQSLHIQNKKTENVFDAVDETFLHKKIKIGKEKIEEAKIEKEIDTEDEIEFFEVEETNNSFPLKEDGLQNNFNREYPKLKFVRGRLSVVKSSNETNKRKNIEENFKGFQAQMQCSSPVAVKAVEKKNIKNKRLSDIEELD